MKKTKELILQTAKDMGYQGVSRDQKKVEETYLMGVVVAERYVKEFPSFYMDIYKKVAQEAAKRGHLTVLEVVDEGKEKSEESFLSFADTGISGVLMIGGLKEAYMEGV